MRSAHTPTQYTDLDLNCTTLTAQQRSQLREWPEYGPDYAARKKMILRQHLTVGTQLNVLTVWNISRAYECRTDRYEATVTKWYKDGTIQVVHTYANGNECKMRFEVQVIDNRATNTHGIQLREWGSGRRYNPTAWYVTSFEQPSEDNDNQPYEGAAQLTLF